MDDDFISSYLNTLIFIIIVKAISVLVLFVLLFDIGWELMYIILTFEIGLVAIIIFAIYAIYALEKKILAKKAAYNNAKSSLDICPDYFVKTGNNICKNTYDTPDGKYRYTFMGLDNENTIIDLNDIIKENETNIDLCYNSNIRTNYDDISWTYLKGKCLSFSNE